MNDKLLRELSELVANMAPIHSISSTPFSESLKAMTAIPAAPHPPVTAAEPFVYQSINCAELGKMAEAWFTTPRNKFRDTPDACGFVPFIDAHALAQIERATAAKDVEIAKWREKALCNEGMADCMDMVRQELIEAGIIDKTTAPMFVANAVCAHIASLATPATVASSEGLDELLGRYWSIAYREGREGVSYGDEANDALHAIREFFATPPQPDQVTSSEAESMAKLQAIQKEYDAFMADSFAQQIGVSFADWQKRYKPATPAPYQQSEANAQFWRDIAAKSPQELLVETPSAKAAAPNKPTDISARLRKFATGAFQRAHDQEKLLLAAADEIERYYGGMMAWKRSAEMQARAAIEGQTLPAADADAYPKFQHPDDSAVERFAAAMKAKMAASRAKGRNGWDNEALCPVERLQAMLNEHVGKGDPVDVGNLAMMLFNRGAGTAADADAVLLAVANQVRWACMNCYSPDDSATDWADKMARLDVGDAIRAAMQSQADNT